tara:strand:+ start:462 stop:1193 length:732 start_codon:yes stop_codon:yes gene_type:complete
MSEYKFPTEMVDLPSKGLIYPPDSPLRSGKVEMKYMTAKEEDILTNQAFIQKGVVLDNLLKALTLNKFNLKTLIPGDKNALIVASRVLGYGKDYSFSIGEVDYTVDLSVLENKTFDESLITPKGTFKFVLPSSENEVEFKLLTELDEEKITQEMEGLQKINKGSSSEITTRLKHQITSINDSLEKNDIREFVDSMLLASDSRALRVYIKEISPDVNLSTRVEIDGKGEEIDIPINLNFFWPDI